MYERQDNHLQCNGRLSDGFRCSNGVRQGSPLSAFLFNVYMELITSGLESVGSGCKVGREIVNHLTYAEDLVLLCPSWRGMQMLIDALFQESNNMIWKVTV
jgi:hypothetical protein